MPASGRMLCKLVSQPDQSAVIKAELPLPWTRSRLISINFDLLNQMPTPQRDLIFLLTICWSTGVEWFKLDLYRGLAIAGVVPNADSAPAVANAMRVLTGETVRRLPFGRLASPGAFG